jgi:ankyrin repeat protein
MNPFDLVAGHQRDELSQLLVASPALAASRNGDGASLLAFCAYMGDADALALVRSALPAIDPYEAIVVGDRARVEAALAEGWDPDSLAPDGFTPLALSVFFRKPELFDLLLPLTRDVNARAKNRQQVAALHAAAAARDIGAVEKLLRAGAQPDLTQQQGFVALHTAAMHGDAVMTGVLLLFGASPGLADASGKTAADHARAQGHEWLARRIAAWAAP